MEYQNVFKRYELKYLITKKQKEKMLSVMEPYMKADKFGRSTICNIYYDTPDYSLIKRSLEGPVYKEKLRLRSYGRAKKDGPVFIEIKKKYKGVVYKRRIAALEEEAMAYLNEDIPLAHPCQISEELDYFKEFYKTLRPSMVISYEREAFFGKEDENFRMTFDENILWRDEDLSLCDEIGGTSILEPDRVLLEVKVSDAMPLWLAEFLSAEKIFKTSFSKYGSAYLQKQKGKTA